MKFLSQVSQHILHRRRAWKPVDCARGARKPCSISDSHQVLPLAKLALKAHACRNPETRDDAPLDLLARLSGSFAGSPILPSRLKWAFIYITPES